MLGKQKYPARPAILLLNPGRGEGFTIYGRLPQQCLYKRRCADAKSAFIFIPEEMKDNLSLSKSLRIKHIQAKPSQQFRAVRVFLIFEKLSIIAASPDLWRLPVTWCSQYAELRPRGRSMRPAFSSFFLLASFHRSFFSQVFERERCSTFKNLYFAATKGHVVQTNRAAHTEPYIYVWAESRSSSSHLHKSTLWHILDLSAVIISSSTPEPGLRGTYQAIKLERQLHKALGLMQSSHGTKNGRGGILETIWDKLLEDLWICARVHRA